MPAETILILGGTGEAVELAARLARSRPAARVITSLAGRTRVPSAPAGEVRTGGFGGAEGLAHWMAENGVTRLVDATHPFAERISANAARASAATGIPCLRLVRPAWEQQPGDNWIEVASLAGAADALPRGATALLALGSQHLDAFAARTDCRLVVRMVDPPQKPVPFAAELLLGKPSTDPDTELTLLQRHQISHLVCRNSGGKGAHAKIAAARRLSLPVVMIARPAMPGGHVVENISAALADLIG